MMTRFGLLVSLVPLLLGACTSAEERSARANEDVANKRLELIEQHQECIEDANGDQAKIDACQHYLDEADALR